MRGNTRPDIPLWTRLLSDIGTLVATTSDRPYRKALSFDVARAEILRQSGTQFDPLATELLVAEQETLRTMVEAKCVIAGAEYSTRETLKEGHVRIDHSKEAFDQKKRDLNG